MGTTTSVFDRTSGLLGGGFVLGQLSDLVKLDHRQTHQAVDRTVALLIGAMADRLEDAADSETVDRWLAHAEMWVLSDVSRHVLNPHAARGGAVVADILGGRWEEHVAELAMNNRVGTRQFAQLVNRVAPVVVAAVAEQQQAFDLDPDNLAAMLAYERDRLIRIGLLAAPPGSQNDDSEQTFDPRSTSELLVRATRNVAKVRASAPPTPRSAGSNDPLPPAWMWWAVATAAVVFVLAWVLSRSVGLEDTPDLATGSEATETQASIDESGSGQDGDDSTQSDTGSANGEVLGESSLPDTPAPSSAVATQAGSSSDEDDEKNADGDGGTGDDVASGTSLNETLELDTVTFQILSSKVTNSGLRVLDEVVDYLATHPEVRIEIAGHTDNDGSDTKNLKLSQARADAVARYLENNGIEADRMDAVGYGEERPKVPNDSTVNKAVNRRIEFTVL